MFATQKLVTKILKVIIIIQNFNSTTFNFVMIDFINENRIYFIDLVVSTDDDDDVT